jgi:phospholipase C
MKAVLVLVLLAFVTAETNVAGKWFDRIMIVFLENQGLDPVLKNSVFKNMTKYGTLLTNYHGSYHPSQPNYVAVIAGDNMGVRNDGQYELKGDSIVDLLEKKGISWKTYQENYPGNCFAEMKNYPYMRKHNAFISFDQIRNNKERCARIVNADHLWNDIGNNTLPQYSFYTPVRFTHFQ